MYVVHYLLFLKGLFDGKKKKKKANVVPLCPLSSSFPALSPLESGHCNATAITENTTE